MTSKGKCVLAYSGGLDTSAIVPWLVDRGYEVHALLVDVGQDEDLHAMCERAHLFGAASATVVDATAEMAERMLPLAIGLGATYEGQYRLGTALARPIIALEQVRLARKIGATTLVHGATGKGNDQVRFEYAYRSLAPDLEILAPWKTWPFEGRTDLAAYLESKGFDLPFEVTKTLSLDENLWHLSVEGGSLEDPAETLDVPAILGSVHDRFGGTLADGPGSTTISITFQQGVPVAIDGAATPLLDLVTTLNQRYRHADWAWDLVLENRFTGVKSRGIYINPAAKLLHFAIDGLARSCLSKTAFAQYESIGAEYANLIYRGEYFSQQRRVVEAAAQAAIAPLDGTVTIHLSPVPYVARIDAASAIFQHALATFEASDYDHADAAGFIRLSWLSSVGQPEQETFDDHPVETGADAAPDIRTVSPVPGGRLVPARP